MQRTPFEFSDPHIKQLRILIHEYIATQDLEQLRKIEALLKNKDFPHNKMIFFYSLPDLNYDIFCRAFEPGYGHAAKHATPIAITLLNVFARNVETRVLRDLLFSPIRHFTKLLGEIRMILIHTACTSSTDLFHAYLEKMTKLVKPSFVSWQQRDSILQARDPFGNSALFCAFKYGSAEPAEKIKFLEAFFKYIFEIKPNADERRQFLITMLNRLVAPKLIDKLLIFCESNFEKHRRIDFFVDPATTAEFSQIVDLINGKTIALTIDPEAEAAERKEEDLELDSLKDRDTVSEFLWPNLKGRKITKPPVRPSFTDPEHDVKVDPDEEEKKSLQKSTPPTKPVVWAPLSGLEFQGGLFGGASAVRSTPSESLAPQVSASHIRGLSLSNPSET